MTAPMKSPAMLRFVTNVRRLREEMHLSARQLAEKITANGIPMTRNMLTNLEVGRRDHVSLDEAYAIASALGTTVTYLVDYAGPRCTQCFDEPPEGYSCNACGAGGDPQ